MPQRLERLIFWLILLVYFGLGAAVASQTPAWQNPDEPAHYNYIAQVAQGTLLPIIGPGDWDQAYLDALRSQSFAPSLLGRLDTVRYENHQPPLYYWLATPIYALSGASLTAVRLFSLALGGLTVVGAYGIAGLLYHAPQVRLTAMGIVAFTPMHLAILASVNNDALAGVVVMAVLWASVQYLRTGQRPALLGLMLGVGFITKTTTYFLVAVVGLALLLHARRVGWHTLWRDGLRVALVAAPFALFWWGRNLLVYGWPDFLGLRAHDAVVVGQLRTADLLIEIGGADYISRLLTTTFQSFWGQFGWMAVPMEGRIYAGIGLVLGLAALGLAWRAMRPGPSALSPANAVPIQREVWALFGATTLLVLAMFVYYNTEFVQFQGRYLFGTIIPLALAVALGACTWQIGWARGWPWLVPLATFGLAAVMTYMLWRYIIPALSLL